jgi:hypothetical protein
LTSKLKRVLGGVVRAVLVLVVIVVGLAAVSVGQARAAWGERLLGFGGELARWDGFRMASEPRRVSINGAQLELVSASTTLSVAEALDRMEMVCEQRGGIVGAEQASQLLSKPPQGRRSWLAPRVRHETEGKGIVACVDTRGPLTVQTLTKRLSAFARSGDLRDVGELRYAVAERHGARTSVLFLWSEGPLALKAMFPKNGDAPGVDPTGVPRPEASRRLLSGIEHGAPYSFTAYTTPAASADGLVAWYRTGLRQTGFSVTEPSPHTLVAKHGERTLVILAAPSRSGVVTSVSELR